MPRRDVFDASEQPSSGAGEVLLPEEIAQLRAQLRALRPRPKKTFKQLADSWMAANAGRLVEPENERRHIDHLRDVWELCEWELSTRAIKAALTKLMKPRGTLGPSTLNKIRSTGKRIISEAQECGEWGGLNPFQVLKRWKERRNTFGTLTLEQVDRVVPHLRKDRRKLTRVMLLVGMRPGEALGLLKQDVNLEAGKILIRRSNGRDTTKTDKWREFPIPESARADLVEAIEASPSEYVFPARNGKRIPQGTKLSRMLRTAMAKADIVTGYNYSCRRKGCGFKEPRPKAIPAKCPRCGFQLWIQGIARSMRFYDLRHSSATAHRKAGADPLAIKLALGHAVRDVTDDIYTHMDEDTMRMELSKLVPKAKGLPGGNRGGLSRAAEGARTLDPKLGKLSPDSSRKVHSTNLLTIREVAAFLRCTVSDVEKLVRSKAMKAIRVGPLTRVRGSEVMDFVRRGGGA